MNKKLDLMQDSSLVNLINELNRLNIQKEDIVGIFKDENVYNVLFYYNI